MAVQFVDMGAVSSSASAATITPVIQTHQVGDTLVALLLNKVSASVVTTPTGWTSTYHNSNASLYTQVWGRIATGSDTDPVISWTGGSGACYAVIARFKGTTAAIFGANGGATFGSVSTHTSASFNSTAGGSLAFVPDFQASSTVQGTTPAGWTLASAVSDATSAISLALWIKTLGISGSASGAISVAETAVAWVQKQSEILAASMIVGPVVKPYLRR